MSPWTDRDQGERAPFVRLVNPRSAVPRRAAFMSYKDLLVVLDPGLQARGRIELAAALAERFEAHLVGLYPLPVPQPPRELGYFDPGLLDPFFHGLREQALAAADKVREQFEHVTRLRGLLAEWRLIAE